ncbi:MAG TPA: hypothetical protein VKZ50_06095 [bacterium]|nr:hypothetical protein [bacterium]
MVSTPEERLKKRAEDLLKHPPETPAQRAARAKQENKQAGERIRSVGQVYLKRAETLIRATNARIYHRLRHSAPGTTEGFTLEVGHYPFVQAWIEGEGWYVTVRSRRDGLSHFRYASNQAFLDAMDDLLEPLVASALEALASGVERPAPEA